MSKFLSAQREQGFPILIEFEPFSRKSLERYLRESQRYNKLLADRKKQIQENIKSLTDGTDKDGMTLEDRIYTYAYGSKAFDDTGGSSGNYCDPDTLYKQYLKIYYDPIVPLQDMYISSMNKLVYEQMKLEMVNQCVDALPFEERTIIVEVYMNNGTAKAYCRDKQLGHTTYNRYKEAAFRHLLFTCNDELKELYELWKKKHEKTSGNNISGMHLPGNN